MTPAREAVRRLVAEGALSMSASGRVATPALSNERIEELASIRALLEPELASRALPRVHMALNERLQAINTALAEVIAKATQLAIFAAILISTERSICARRLLRCWRWLKPSGYSLDRPCGLCMGGCNVLSCPGTIGT